MVMGIRDKAEQTDFQIALRGHANVSPAELHDEVITLEQSLASAHREIEILQRALEANRARDAQTEVSITATLARFEVLQEEKIALAAEVVELREQLTSSERTRSSEQLKVTALQKEKAALAAELATLREQLASFESARASEQAKVTGLQKEKTSLSAQIAKLRHELATSERKLKVLYSSTSWRITRPLRRVKLPSMWKKTR
ncbi:hypothetical protein CN059_21520 [Sinorhizobium medicae]|uniref:Uncharacterized protein n=1 Tax=Sinorhizobium medicae TaxID=110321 RepID=A0ABX4TVH5_9HYPH|nr:hypothetical protein [Sinorhizobium medicae]MDX0716801.1 hypothetical protein [Sinorhizobium medicae]MDX0846294.1 hypothetical protein [Sinorhizobium medicae]MDX1060387.1 hypothetical protein [Sinorhizobium medicae]PLU09347.1 hypothetical protein BMJ33_01045 [Sinorhizobium medicae]PLU76578.1 hypothetical protein BMJ19_28525 [Sinorhizobium medicae]